MPIALPSAAAAIGIERLPLSSTQFLDTRTYAACQTAADAAGKQIKAFTLTCPGPTASTYTLQADGVAAEGMGGFQYFITNTGAKSSKGGTGWADAATCWAVRKSGDCT